MTKHPEEDRRGGSDRRDHDRPEDRPDRRSADDPFDRERLARLRAIADPNHPENDPLAMVDTLEVEPGDGGITGPEEGLAADWTDDPTLAEDPD